jgi:hypothetical protein
MMASLCAAAVLVVVLLLLARRRTSTDARGAREGANQIVLAEFVVRSLDLGSLADVLADAAATAQTAFGASRSVVFEPGAKEGLWDAWLPGPQALEPVPDAAKPAFGWLKHNAEVIALDEVSGPRYGAMRLPLTELKTRYGVDLLVPLVDRPTCACTARRRTSSRSRRRSTSPAPCSARSCRRCRRARSASCTGSATRARRGRRARTSGPRTSCPGRSS